LSGPQQDQIVIVGGSFAGLTAAYCLAKAGYSVSLLEAGSIGYAASRSAGVVCSSLERDFLDYVNTYGVDTAKRMWQFSVQGVKFVSQLVAELDPQNKSQLETTGSFYTSYPEDQQYMKEEAAARNAAGFSAQYFEDHLNPFYEDGAHLGIYTPDDVTINPYQFCQVLAGAAVSLGVKIYESSSVIRLDKENRRCTTKHGSLQAEKILLAGQAIPGQFDYNRREMNLLTFCLATAPLTASQIEFLGLSARGSFWDANQPFFYGRLTMDNRLIIGGDDLWAPMAWLGLQNTKLDRLEKRARDRIPFLEEIPIEHRWGGPLTIMSDAMPTLGAVSNIFIGGNSAGISQAVMVGKILAGMTTNCYSKTSKMFSYKRPVSLIPNMYSSKELFHMIMSLAGIF
jgi:glycine/D-amino acid oxidase-like deaminating enzyme